MVFGQDRARANRRATSCRSRCRRRRSRAPTSSRRRCTRSAAASRRSGADLLVNIEGKQRPMFAYTYQTIDDQKGSNHDGQVQRGEQVRMLVTVKNIGKGRAHAHRGGAAQRHRAGGHPDQRRPLRGQGPGAGRDQDVLVRLRGAPRLQGRRLPAGAGGRRHDAGRVGDRQDQGQGRAGGAGARAADGHGDRHARRTRRCARRRATARWSSAAPPRGPCSRPAASWARSRASSSTARRSAFIATADVKAGGAVARRRSSRSGR